jgi:hypothetical protein
VGGALVRAPARADWPYSVLVNSLSGGVGPDGAAIRNWGPLDEVYIAVERTGATGQFYRYTCSNNDGCATATLVSGYPKSFGSALSGTNSFQVAAAVRLEGGTPVVELAARQYRSSDCTSSNGDSTDLRAFSWAGGTSAVTAGDYISISPTSGTCPDRGLAQLRDNGGSWNACYTYHVSPAPADAALDRVRCNDDTPHGNPWWQNEIEMTSPGGLEDHPSFDFKDGGRIVLASNRPSGNGNDKAEFHFPDDTAPPSEPKVGILTGADATESATQYPDVVTASTVNGDVVHAVVEGGSTVNRDRIESMRCLGTVDCVPKNRPSVGTAGVGRPPQPCVAIQMVAPEPA